MTDLTIKIELSGVGTLMGEMIRTKAPLSADAIIDKMPFAMRGRFSFGSKKYWTIPDIGIWKGPNQKNAVQGVNKGDLVYNPKTDELIIMLEDSEMPNKVNIVGIINDNLDVLLNARNGLNTKFLKKK